MHYKSFSLLIILLLSWSFSNAQDKEGTLEIIKDPRIELLQKRRVLLNTIEEPSSEVRNEHRTKGTAMGFRVQIYSGSSRNEAYAVQSRFQQQYPEISTYVSYTQPNYRVKVGDFRSRREAQAFMREAKQNFPTVFLFTEQINVYY